MKTRIGDLITHWAIRVVTYLVVLAIGYIIYDIVRKGAPALSWQFLSASPMDAGDAGGILPAIVGTVCLVLGTIAVALPLGMGSAIYLTEYARQGRINETVRLGVVTLAGIPSIVFGLFGLGLFVTYLHFGHSLLAGSLTLACMVLPTIIVASEEALLAVPKSLREGSLALGATQWQTIARNVLPYAVPGMTTGSILAIARAAGETAPILLTAAVFINPRLPDSLLSEVMALPTHLYALASQNRSEVMQHGTALVLLMLVLGLNLIAILLRNYVRKRTQW